MPWRKRYTGRYAGGPGYGHVPVRHYRAGPYRKRCGKKGSFACKVRSVLADSAERKYRDFGTTTTTPVSGTSEVIYMTDIDEGVGATGRTGDTIYITGIQIRASVAGNSGVTSDTIGRILLVRGNKNVEGSIAVVSHILASDNVTALSNPDNKGDYTVYWNKRFILPMRDAAASAVTPVKLIDYYKKFKKPMKCHYDGTGGGISDAEAGHWFLVLMTNKAAASQPSWTYQCRVSFKEMA